MQSIHIRSPEIEDRYWTGDQIKGAGNHSWAGTLVERTISFVVLAKMDNATTKAGVDNFAAMLNRKRAAAMRKMMIYVQGRERHCYKILTDVTAQIYFADRIPLVTRFQ
jgi:IS30 family transposase